MRAVLIACAACQPATPPVLANSAAPTSEAHVPFAPCPKGTQGAIEHELFRGCAPAPYNEPFAPCPHGECPRPCRVQLVGGGTQSVEYDARGRFVVSRGNESRLLDQKCTYRGERVDACHLLYESREITTQKAWRDGSGQIVGTSSGEPMVGYDPHYTWEKGRIVGLHSSMQDATYTYSGDRLIASDMEDMGDKQRITYTYDTAGDVIASSQDGAFIYDARKRLVAAGKLRLEWDERDRLIRSTLGTTSYTYTYDCK